MAPAPTLRAAAATALGAPILVLLVAGLGQAALRRSLDLRDLPGPGGVKVLTALATQNLDRDGLTRLTGALLPFFSDPLQALRAVVASGALLAVAGALLAGRALAGPRAGLLAGLVAASFGQALFTSVLLGPDAPAWGLAWLGVGLSWMAARQGGAWLPLAAVGSALAVIGVSLKVNAAPSLAMLVLAPLLMAPRQPLRRLAVIALMALGGGSAGLRFLPEDPTQQAEAPQALDLAAVQDGLAAIVGLADHQQPAGTPLVQLALLGLVGAALPGPRWGIRLLLAAVGLIAAGLTASTVGELLRPRYLLAAMLPAVLLAGALGGLLLDGLAVLAHGRRPLARRMLALGLTAALLAPLLLDGLAYLQAWSRQREGLLGSAPAAMPRAPEAWARRYSRMSLLDFTDSSEIGALSLVQLASAAPPGGVASVPLRDAREFHLSAGAALNGHDYRILEERRCCGGLPAATCAAQVVDALDAAGARLVLPLPVDGQMRVPRPHQAWWAALRQAAEARGGGAAADAWWWVREPRGSGGALPCPVPGAAPRRR